MENAGVSLTELPWFLAYMATAVVLTLIYLVIYMWVTPHQEIKLIRENNLAAALAFAGSLICFCLPLASAIAQSVALVDCDDLVGRLPRLYRGWGVESLTTSPEEPVHTLRREDKRYVLEAEWLR